MSDKPFRNQCERSTSSNRRSTIALRCSSRPSDMLGSYEPSSAGTCCARLLGRLWLASDLKEWEPRLPRRATYRPEGRTTGQWRCRICSFRSLAHRDWKRKNGTLYTTSFYACSRCSVMFLNPEQFNVLGDAAPNIEMATVVALPARRK